MSAGGENLAVRSGRILVKFRDEYKVRCSPGLVGNVLTCASTRAAGAIGANGQPNPIAPASSLVDRFSGTIQPAIHKSVQQLADLEKKAATKSKIAQPDLAGYMYITVTPSALSAAAEAFNDLDCVEFAQVDYLPIPAQCPDRDISLQKGPASEGADIGINCQLTTDNNGNPLVCAPPGPVFVVGTDARSFSRGAGVIGCNRPSRWVGYTVNFITADCVSYAPPAQPVPSAQWDCTACNQGGGIGTGSCVQPAIGFVSNTTCQYGCRSLVCADYLATTLGFAFCTNQEDPRGWDSVCATLANIYCPTIINIPTPYNNSSIGDGGMPQVDLATQTCYGVLLNAAQTWAFDDIEVYDPCFSLRGPALPGITGTVAGGGILKFTDIGNGNGIRPWGFTGAASNFAFPFLHQIIPLSTNTPAPTSFSALANCAGLRSNPRLTSTTSQFFQGGTMLSVIDPLDSNNASFAEYDNAFKSQPFAFSHDCFSAVGNVPGCNLTQCCVYVCVNDSSCCSIGWDAACVNQARTNTELCQSGALTATAVGNWASPPPAPGIPSFEPVEIDSGTTTNFKARNLALFGNGLPNVLSTSEYISQIQKIASGSLAFCNVNAPSPAPIPAPTFYKGVSYTIKFTGTTTAPEWLALGAPSSAVGTVFISKITGGSGTGTGVAAANALPSITPTSLTFAQTTPLDVPADELNFKATAGAITGYGQCYRIKTVGTTNWTLVGASSSNVGVIFVATAQGAGTGIATSLSIPLPLDESYDFLNTGFSGGGIDVAGMKAFTSGILRNGVPLSSDCIEGSLTQIGVIDYSAILDHIDLLGQVTVETGQVVVVPTPGTSTIINPEHGTAVLGVLVAADNGFGIKGLLPRAQATFFPAVTSLQGGRVASAIIAAGEILGDGDVLCIPLEYGAGYTLAADQFVNQLFSVVDSLGATIVIPAGNGGFEVQQASPVIAITVGAAWPGRQTPIPYGSSNALQSSSPVYPGTEYCRYRSSNWGSAIGNGYIDVAGWGSGICTLGEGTLFNNKTSLTPATPQQNYQANFGQTSGACAMIAGLVGALNGFSEEVFGGSIGTQRIRNILNNVAVDTQGNPTGAYLGSVITQCGYGAGVPLPSTVSDSPQIVANGDILLAPATDHNVGGFPLASICLENVFINESYPGGSPFDMQVITGTPISGNKFALGTLNNKFLQIQAQQKGRGSLGSGYGPSIQYIGMGLATDIQVRSTLLVSDVSLVNDVLFQGYGMITGGGGASSSTNTGSAIGILYAYNRRANRWIYLNFGFLNGVAPMDSGVANVSERLSFTGYNPQDFVVTEGSDKVVYTRYLTFGFGVVGAYRVFWDQIFVQMNPPAPI